MPLSKFNVGPTIDRIVSKILTSTDVSWNRRYDAAESVLQIANSSVNQKLPYEMIYCSIANPAIETGFSQWQIEKIFN